MIWEASQQGWVTAQFSIPRLKGDAGKIFTGLVILEIRYPSTTGYTKAHNMPLFACHMAVKWFCSHECKMVSHNRSESNFLNIFLIMGASCVLCCLCEKEMRHFIQSRRAKTSLFGSCTLRCPHNLQILRTPRIALICVFVVRNS